MALFVGWLSILVTIHCTITLVIPGDAVLRVELLDIYHNSPVGGHLGLYRMAHSYLTNTISGACTNCQTRICNCLV